MTRVCFTDFPASLLAYIELAEPASPETGFWRGDQPSSVHVVATRQLSRSSSRLLAKRLPILARLDCQRDWGRETGISESGYRVAFPRFNPEAPSPRESPGVPKT